MRQLAIVFAGFLVACSLQPADAILFSGSSSGGGGGGGGGGSPTALVAMTVTNPSGSTQTNMPFCLGLPLAATSLASGDSIEVIDGDTSLAIPVDENNRATDMNSAIRSESVCGVIPSATGSQKKSLQINVVSGVAPATGTDITVSEIDAYMTLNGYSMPVTFTDINGVTGTWTADLQTALTSGNSGWVNKSTATVMGKHRSGGGIVTEYVIYSPVSKAGTPDSQLYVEFDLRCFKTLRTAVNTSTNPIRGCVVYALVYNGWMQQVSPVDKWYGLSVGAGGTYGSFPITTPATTLTLASTAVGYIAMTASGSTFTLNSQGQVISDGTGLGFIADYTNGTTAAIETTIAFGSTTISSGTYKIYGMGHPYMAAHKYRAVFGNPMPLDEDGNVYLGSAWNTGTLSGGPGAYVKSTGMMMNLAMTTAQATSVDAVNLLSLAGNNPNSSHQGYVGPYTTYLESSGQRMDIGVEPDFIHAAVIRYDSNAANLIFKTADYWATFPNQVRDANTGLNGTPCNAGTPPSCTASVQWTFDNRFGGTAIAAPSYASYGVFSLWAPDQLAHDPSGFYMAALLSGDYFYIASQQMSAFYVYGNLDSTATGISKTVFIPDGGPGTNMPPRAQAWGGMFVANAVLLTPESSTVLGMTKAAAKQWQANQYGAVAMGAKTLFIDKTGPGLQYGTDGPHYTNEGNSSYSNYMTGYHAIALANQYERGMLDANGIAFKNWLAKNAIDYVNNTTDMNISGIGANGYTMIRAQPAACLGTRQSDWAGVYKQNALSPLGLGQRGPSRVITSGSTMTLSATSGSAVTATFNGSHNWFNTAAFYVGGWIQTSDGGRGRITAINNANQAVIDTTASATYWDDNTGSCHAFSGVTFGTTVYTGNGLFDDQANINIPNAAPGDPNGPYWPMIVATGGGVDYYNIVQTTIIMSKDQGVSGASAACTTAIPGGTMLSNWTQKWYISPRTGAC